MLDDEEQQREERLTRLGTYLHILELLNSRKTLLFSLKEMQRLEIHLRSPEAGSYLVPTLIQKFRADEVDSLLAWLEQLGFLADLKDFDPISWPNYKGREVSVWGSVLAELKDEKRLLPEIAKKLAKQSSRTFGETVLLSFAEEKASRRLSTAKGKQCSIQFASARAADPTGKV